MKKVSMQTIADKVGVSRCAVSLVLSGKAQDKRISESLAKKILDVAKELNYKPNTLARGLRTGSTMTIGVIVADISNEFFGELVYHIQQRAFELGYSIIVTNSNEDPERMMSEFDLLVNKQVDGIIMVPSNNSQEITAEIAALSMPLVQVDRYLPGINASYVILDNFKASASLTESLYSRGCRRIAMFRHSTSALNGRLEGYVKVLEDHCIYDRTLVKNIDYSSEKQDVDNAIDEMFSTPGTVDAIIFQSHELFLAGMKRIRQTGVDFKDKVKIASFDKTDAFALLDFPLLYVEQPIDSIGSEAVNILVGQINGTEVITEKIFEGRIVEIKPLHD